MKCQRKRGLGWQASPEQRQRENAAFHIGNVQAPSRRGRRRLEARRNHRVGRTLVIWKDIATALRPRMHDIKHLTKKRLFRPPLFYLRGAPAKRGSLAVHARHQVANLSASEIQPSQKLNSQEIPATRDRPHHAFSERISPAPEGRQQSGQHATQNRRCLIELLALNNERRQ